jgi:hypothetical protein
MLNQHPARETTDRRVNLTNSVNNEKQIFIRPDRAQADQQAFR